MLADGIEGIGLEGREGGDPRKLVGLDALELLAPLPVEVLGRLGVERPGLPQGLHLHAQGVGALRSRGAAVLKRLHEGAKVEARLLGEGHGRVAGLALSGLCHGRDRGRDGLFLLLFG